MDEEGLAAQVSESFMVVKKCLRRSSEVCAVDSVESSSKCRRSPDAAGKAITVGKRNQRRSQQQQEDATYSMMAGILQQSFKRG